MTMRERVAKALFNDGDYLHPWEDFPDGSHIRSEYLRKADAAIEAMREPTDEMLAAVKAPVGSDWPSPHATWRAMFGAAR